MKNIIECKGDLKVGERTRTVMVGLNFGRRLISWAFNRGNAGEFIELVGVCDFDADLVAECSKEYSCIGYCSLDEVLEDDSVEAIILMTGPVGRAKLIRKIIRAGKDVMTTKPFETDAGEAASVLEEARQAGRFVYMNAPCPSQSEDLRIIANWRWKYDLGRPVAAHFESWYKRVEEADSSWYDDPDRCFVAPIMRLGIYGICDFLQILGEPSVQSSF